MGVNANPDEDHTCYSPTGEIFVDQAFDVEQFADGAIYMPEFGVCMQVASIDTGGDRLNWPLATDLPCKAGFSMAKAQLRPHLCLTLADETGTRAERRKPDEDVDASDLCGRSGGLANLVQPHSGLVHTPCVQ